MMFSALFFFFVYTCLLLNRFYFPFSPGVGPGRVGGRTAPCGASGSEAHLPGDLSAVPALTLEPVLETPGEDET